MACSNRNRLSPHKHHPYIPPCSHICTSHLPNQCMFRHFCMGSSCTRRSFPMDVRSSKFSTPGARRAYRRTWSRWSSIRRCTEGRRYLPGIRGRRIVCRLPNWLMNMDGWFTWQRTNQFRLHCSIRSRKRWFDQHIHHLLKLGKIKYSQCYFILEKEPSKWFIIQQHIPTDLFSIVVIG